MSVHAAVHVSIRVLLGEGPKETAGTYNKRRWKTGVLFCISEKKLTLQGTENALPQAYLHLFLKYLVLQFEYQQAQLEAEVENLSWKVERAEITDRGVSSFPAATIKITFKRTGLHWANRSSHWHLKKNECLLWRKREDGKIVVVFFSFLFAQREDRKFTLCPPEILTRLEQKVPVVSVSPKTEFHQIFAVLFSKCSLDLSLTGSRKSDGCSWETQTDAGSWLPDSLNRCSSREYCHTGSSSVRFSALFMLDVNSPALACLTCVAACPQMRYLDRQKIFLQNTPGVVFCKSE